MWGLDKTHGGGHAGRRAWVVRVRGGDGRTRQGLIAHAGCGDNFVGDGRKYATAVDALSVFVQGLVRDEARVGVRA